MFHTFVQKIKLIATDAMLRRRILFILGALVIFRFLNTIPVPGVDTGALANFLSSNQLFGFINIFSGGGLSTLSILLLGVAPYITASIILQLLTLMVPRLKEMYHEEGEMGRRKFYQYARLLTVIIAAIQGFGLLSILRSQGVFIAGGIFDFGLNVIVVIAGALLAMWIGELISEFGIGNGISILIFAGIVSVIPTTVSQTLFTFDIAQLPTYIAVLILGIVIVFGVVYVTEAERQIPVIHAKHQRDGQAVGGGAGSYVPLRINQAGVMPIIFALSILLLPNLLGNAMAGMANITVQNIGNWIVTTLANPWIYAAIYFVMVFVFTYFYTAVTFDADARANELQKQGAFVPGIRPGASTAEYISKVLARITFFGGLFLGLIAVLPQIFLAFTGNQSFALGGTSLLIVISVVIDLLKKINAQVSMQEY